jgi:hypothetical protein
MYALFPYLWMLLMLAMIVATIVAAVLGKQKKPKRESNMPGLADEVIDPLSDTGGNSLDFGDELTPLDK